MTTYTVLESLIDASENENASAAAIETWMDTIFDNHHDGTNRRQVVSYLSNLIETDEVTVRSHHAKINAARNKLRSLSASLAHPTTHMQPILTQISLTTVQKDAAYRALLQTDNSQVYVGSHDFTAHVYIDGDNIHYIGETNGLAALNDQLVADSSLTATLYLKGSNITVEGLNIVTQTSGSAYETGKRSILFNGACENVTFKNCVFDGADKGFAVWWEGVGDHLSTG